MTTKAEENYLKAIFKIAERDGKSASTNAIAAEIQTSAASVTDMIKRLAEKGLVNYARYRGVTLSETGKNLATNLVRKHRLWESFLVNKLGFNWSEVHDIAEELEHIKSDALIDKLDSYLGHPKFDPHGDPIPSRDGKFTLRTQVAISELEKLQKGEVVAVRENNDAFLRHLEELGLIIGQVIDIVDSYPYDASVRVRLGESEFTISEKVAKNVYVRVL